MSDFLSEYDYLLEDDYSLDLRFTHDREIINGIPERPKGSLVYYIGNYPSEEILESVDVYAKDLKPPNKLWDDVLNTGSKKDISSGWNSTGFEPKYKEMLANEDVMYMAACKLRARAMARTIYVGHHRRSKMYSPARVLIQFVEDYVTLESEGGHPEP